MPPIPSAFGMLMPGNLIYPYIYDVFFFILLPPKCLFSLQTLSCKRVLLRDARAEIKTPCMGLKLSDTRDSLAP